MLRPIIAWLAILVLAALNGGLRELVLLPGLSRRAAFITSGLLLCALVLLIAIALTRWLRLDTAARAVRVGFLWLWLTLVFEFGLGIVQGRSWTEILEPYTFKDGNIWPLVLLVVLLAPRIGFEFSRSRT